MVCVIAWIKLWLFAGTAESRSIHLESKIPGTYVGWARSDRIRFDATRLKRK
jgi:hypothetical protein